MFDHLDEDEVSDSDPRWTSQAQKAETSNHIEEWHHIHVVHKLYDSSTPPNYI